MLREPELQPLAARIADLAPNMISLGERLGVALVVEELLGQEVALDIELPQQQLVLAARVIEPLFTKEGFDFLHPLDVHIEAP